MFSRKLVTTLKASVATIRQDRSASPSVVAVAHALQALSEEADRLAPVVAISDTGSSVQIVCGSASITLKADGTIAVKGGAMTINATGDFTVKSLKNTTIDGATVNIN
jgi:hypothetical protein